MIKSTHKIDYLHKNFECLHKLGGALIKNTEYVT